MKTEICKTIRTVTVLAGLVMLTGCPGYGDIMVPSESTSVSMKGEEVCFFVANPKNYQPIFIAINPREIPIKERSFIDKPRLSVVKDQLCIPSSFYKFEDGKQYVVDYVLSPNGLDAGDKFTKRSVIVGVEMASGRAHLIKLNNDEY